MRLGADKRLTAHRRLEKALREEKKREAENAIKDLKRTAAMVGEKFKTIVHQEKK